jgi:preprotein translocase subunit SecG
VNSTGGSFTFLCLNWLTLLYVLLLILHILIQKSYSKTIFGHFFIKSALVFLRLDANFILNRFRSNNCRVGPHLIDW